MPGMRTDTFRMAVVHACWGAAPAVAGTTAMGNMGSRLTVCTYTRTHCSNTHVQADTADLNQLIPFVPWTCLSWLSEIGMWTVWRHIHVSLGAMPRQLILTQVVRQLSAVVQALR